MSKTLSETLQSGKASWRGPTEAPSLSHTGTPPPLDSHRLLGVIHLLHREVLQWDDPPRLLVLRKQSQGQEMSLRPPRLSSQTAQPEGAQHLSLGWDLGDLTEIHLSLNKFCFNNFCECVLEIGQGLTC